MASIHRLSSNRRPHFRAVKVKGTDLVLELKVGTECPRKLYSFVICRSEEVLRVLLDPCNQMCYIRLASIE